MAGDFCTKCGGYWANCDCEQVDPYTEKSAWTAKLVEEVNSLKSQRRDLIFDLRDMARLLEEAHRVHMTAIYGEDTAFHHRDGLREGCVVCKVIRRHLHKQDGGDHE